MSIQTGEGRKLLELFIIKHRGRFMASVEDSSRSRFLLCVRAVPCFETRSLFANSSSVILISRIGTVVFSLPHIIPPPSPICQKLLPPLPPTPRLHCCLYVHAGALRLLVRSSVKMFAIKSCCSYMVLLATDGVVTMNPPGNCGS